MLTYLIFLVDMKLFFNREVENRVWSWIQKLRKKKLAEDFLEKMQSQQQMEGKAGRIKSKKKLIGEPACKA